MEKEEFKKLTTGFKAEKVAELIGKSATTVQSYASGRARIPEDVANRLTAISEMLDRLKYRPFNQQQAERLLKE